MHTVALTNRQLEEIWGCIAVRNKDLVSWSMQTEDMSRVEREVVDSLLRIIKQIQNKLLPCLKNDNSITAKFYVLAHKEVE